MKTLPVALQLYSVRDFAEKDAEGTLKQVKEIGYDAVELAGLYGRSPEEMRALLDKTGLPAMSAHVSIHELADDPDAAVARYKTIGCRYMAIPSLPPEMRPGAADFADTLAIINRLGQLCSANGMTLLYHNHDFEFNILPDGAFGLDHLYTTVSVDILQTQLDTCWIRVAGQDPAAYVRKYAGRCPVVHLKDYIKEGEPARMYELIGEKESQSGDGAGSFEFRPVGYGAQDFPSILTAAVESGAEWVVVEQDQSVGRTSLEAARLSRDYLKTLGW